MMTAMHAYHTPISGIFSHSPYLNDRVLTPILELEVDERVIGDALTVNIGLIVEQLPLHIFTCLGRGVPC